MSELLDTIEESVQPLRTRRKSDFTRLDAFFPVLAGKKKPPRIRTGQEYGKPSRLYFPGLEAKPWHDAANHAELAPVQSAFKDIRREAVSACKGEMDPAGGDREDRGLIYKKWSTYTFHDLDPFIPTDGRAAERFQRTERKAHYAACPKTGAAARKADLPGQFLFARLEPGGHVAPHTSEGNFVLNAHMGLVVPKDSWLKVHGETRGWEEGRFIVFDDTFEHEAKNDSQEERIILWCLVWHPGLTAVERQVLKTVLDRLTVHKVL
jgi:aspartyl/asparaginyl beta-hydroxylase (cupin superfamily)